MISPTGKGIRSDSEGSGEYGASRGKRLHNGIDHECEEGQEVVAPFDLKIDRISYPNSDMIMQGIAWSAGKSTGRLFYFKPITEFVGEEVKQGQVIGHAQAVSKYYGLPEMKDHTHFRIDK